MYLCDFSLPESLDVRESHFHSLSVWSLGPQKVGKSYRRLRVLWDPRVGMEESPALRCLKPPQGQLCNGTLCCLTAVKKWKASVSSVVWLNHGFVLTNWYDNFVINNHLRVVYALKKKWTVPRRKMLTLQPSARRSVLWDSALTCQRKIMMPGCPTFPELWSS